MTKKSEIHIRSSAAEFLIFSNQSKSDSIEVRFENGTLWLTQKMMAQLFDVESNTVTYHLGEVYKSGELEENATTRKFRVVQLEGGRDVNREIIHYNLDAIISVGYRVNSLKATQFRRWATEILKHFKALQKLFAKRGITGFRKRVKSICSYYPQKNLLAHLK